MRSKNWHWRDWTVLIFKNDYFWVVILIVDNLKRDEFSDIPDVDNVLRLLGCSTPRFLSLASNPSVPLLEICACFSDRFTLLGMCPFLNPTKAVQFGLQPFKRFALFPFRNRLFHIFFVEIGWNFQDIIKIYYGHRYDRFSCAL